MHPLSEREALAQAQRDGGGAGEEVREAFRRDVQLGAEQQQLLQQRGPVGSRIVELAALDGPVHIKRIPNAPRPVALAKGLSGPAPSRRPTSSSKRAKRRATVVFPVPGLPVKMKFMAARVVVRAAAGRSKSVRTLV